MSSIFSRIFNAIHDAIVHYVKPDMPPKEVESVLDKVAADDPEKLNWKTSIVDLMKLLGLDSSREARKELWNDLVHEGEYTGSPQQNVKLMDEVRKGLAEHSIRLPHTARE